MSVHDELSVRIELERELAGITPRGDVAAAVIGRYRRERRRKMAGAAGLAVAVAGLGVPLTMTASGAPAQPGTPAPPGAVLRIAAYTLHLPAFYRPQPCAHAAAASGQPSVTAADAGGGCIILALAPGSRRGKDIVAGRYHLRLIPHGVVVNPPAPGAAGLSVTATSLSQPAVQRLVATGLGYAA